MNDTMMRDEAPVMETLSLDTLEDVGGGRGSFSVEVSGNSGGGGVTVKIGFQIQF